MTQEPAGQKRHTGDRPLIQAVFYNDPDFYPPAINAIRQLCRAGFSIELFTRETGKPHHIAYPPEAHIVRLAPRGRNSWLQFLNFLREVVLRARPNAAVFWGHDMHGFVGARLAAWRQGRPLVYHCHDFADPGWMTRGIKLVHAFERAFARTADAVVVPDAGRAEVIARVLGLRTAPLVAANSPPLRPLEKNGTLQTALAAQGKQFDLTVFRQGKVGRGHGLEMTVRSLPLWRHKRSGFVVMGIVDEDYATMLQGLAERLGVTDRFALLPPVPYDHVFDFIAGADVGHALYDPIHVNHAYPTTSSNKLMEYLAAGLPTLLSNNLGMMELSRQHECGIVVDASQPDCIAQGVNMLAENAVARQRIGQAARRAFEDHFCFERQFTQVMETIRVLASRR
jgi:glycosyltransferase involved in cell wall biosynthesis